ncbi:MAG: DUF2130 domain-containing protein [Chloroflexi bacterium]|nr:MAG: DUF2130 domain-containing protein [Chloroflexota bacterium]
MNTITCSHCGEVIEIDKALEGQIEARVLSAERHKHQQEMDRLKTDQEALIDKERKNASQMAERQLAGEKELLQKQAAADLELEKKRIALDLANQQRKADSEQQDIIATLKADAENAKADSKKLRDDLGKLMDQLRESNKAKDNAELEAKKMLAEGEAKIREEAQKSADEVNGADIAHTVRSPRGTDCGVMLWEIKRTKNWVDGWIPKLKDDVRAAKASVAIIVTEVMPKQIEQDMGQLQGVWICKPKLAIIIGSLLRKSLLDVGRQKAMDENRGDKADALYNFVTSHEFIQQIESMVETYTEMATQVTKERVAYEKLWSQREKQAQKLLLSTANIVGSMQGSY